MDFMAPNDQADTPTNLGSVSSLQFRPSMKTNKGFTFMELSTKLQDTRLQLFDNRFFQATCCSCWI